MTTPEIQAKQKAYRQANKEKLRAYRKANYEVHRQRKARERKIVHAAIFAEIVA